MINFLEEAKKYYNDALNDLCDKIKDLYLKALEGK